MIKISSLPCLLCLLLGMGAANAATPGENPDDNQQWFQVDLIVFKNLSKAAEQEEKWRRDLHLRYPEDLLRLKSANAYARETCVNAESTRRRECLDLLSSDPATPWPPQKTGSALQLTEKAAQRATGAINAEAPFLPPPAYVLLNDREEEMREVLRSLNRSSLYRVVFAGTWAQPLIDRESSPHILIRGGEAFDDHFELEGDIKVSLERYLHVSTDLWLSHFSPIAQLPVSQPAWAGNSQFASPQANLQEIWPLLPIPMAGAKQQQAVTPEPMSEEMRSAIGEYRGETGELSPSEDEMAETSPRSNLEALIANDKRYYVDRTVVMRQQRRMRSGELHYIDHPLFGVLVKITPLPRQKTAPGKNG